MDDKSIGLQADTIALEGRKSVTLLSGNECMVLSSEKSIIKQQRYQYQTGGGKGLRCCCKERNGQRCKSDDRGKGKRNGFGRNSKV